MTSGECICLAAVIALLLRQWRKLYRRPSCLAGGAVVKIRGVADHAGQAGAPLLSDGELELPVRTEDGADLKVVLKDADVKLWPGPGSPRPRRDLRGGDRVTVFGISSGERFEALRLIRGHWPRLSWAPTFGVAGFTLAGMIMIRALSDPVQVDRQYAAAGDLPLFENETDHHHIWNASRKISAVYDWRGFVPKRSEPFRQIQTFPGYVRSRPNLARGLRRALYVQPIGSFDDTRRQVLDLSADYLSRYFCMPVKIATPLDLSRIPPRARRNHPTWGVHQLLTTYIIHELLRLRRPQDAAAYLGLTATDLWPGIGWHAVYGQASPVSRVGVVSMFRHGDPTTGVRGFRQALLRTLKVAAHETGHMFSMQHCANRACIMSGRNSRKVADRRFPILCPHCLAKVLWATRCDPVERYRRLISFCWKYGFDLEATVYQRLLHAVLDNSA